MCDTVISVYYLALYTRVHVELISVIFLQAALVARSPPSTISLAGGFPNPKLFPFESAEITLRYL